MKKNLCLHIWSVVCLFVVAILILTTAFNYSVVCSLERDMTSLDSSSLRIEGEKEYELSEFCDTMEKIAASDKSQIVNYGGKMLATYGVGADEEYDVISFAGDLLERIMDNFRFDLSALVASPFKNLFVYIFCFALLVSGFSMFIKGFFSSAMGLLGAVKNNDQGKEPHSSVGIALSAPALMWLSAFAFGFYNSYSLKSTFKIENAITINYTQGCNYLVLFIAAMLIYFIGTAVISSIFGKKANPKPAEKVSEEKIDS